MHSAAARRQRLHLRVHDCVTLSPAGCTNCYASATLPTNQPSWSHLLDTTTCLFTHNQPLQCWMQM